MGSAGFSLLPLCVGTAGSTCPVFGVGQPDFCKPGVAFGASAGREGKDPAGTAPLVPKPLTPPRERAGMDAPILQGPAAHRGDHRGDNCPFPS